MTSNRAMTLAAAMLAAAALGGGCNTSQSRDAPPRPTRGGPVAPAPGPRMRTGRPVAPLPPADASSPQGAASALLRALDARDATGVRASLYAATPKEAMLADALAPLLVAARRLEQATARRFGPDAARRLGANVARLDPLPTYAATPWKVEGDRALFQRDSRAMVRADGRWRLVIPEAEQEEAAARQTAQTWQRESQVMARTAAEVESGRYRSDEELLQTFTRRVAEAPRAPG